MIDIPDHVLTIVLPGGDCSQLVLGESLGRVEITSGWDKNISIPRHMIKRELAVISIRGISGRGMPPPSLLVGAAYAYNKSTHCQYDSDAIEDTHTGR